MNRNGIIFTSNANFYKLNSEKTASKLCSASVNTLLITQIKYNFHTCKVSSPESKEHNKVRVKYVDVGPSAEQLLQT